MEKVELPLLGHLQLDAEHANLAAFINICDDICPDVLAACKDCKSEKCHQCLKDLHKCMAPMLSSIKSHFKNEENLMVKAGMGSIDPVQMAFHLGAHHDLLALFEQEFSAKLHEASPANLPDLIHRLRSFLHHELRDHITQFDLELIPHLRRLEASARL